MCRLKDNGERGTYLNIPNKMKNYKLMRQKPKFHSPLVILVMCRGKKNEEKKRPCLNIVYKTHNIIQRTYNTL